MRLAKGFFLPVLVAQIANLSLPFTLGRVWAGSPAGLGRRFSGGSLKAFLKNSRMRLAKGFFLPVLVAQNADLSLPSALGRVSGGSRPGLGRVSAGGSPEVLWKLFSKK